MAWFKQIPLNLRGQIVSVHDYYRADKTHQMLLRQGSCSLSFGRLGFLSAMPEIWCSFSQAGVLRYECKGRPAALVSKA
jgi:hypothetical protein